MSDRKQKYSLSTNVNNEVNQKLDQIVAPFNSNPDADLGPLIDFSEKSYNLTQLITNWSYFSTTNDHGSFTECTVKMTKLIRVYDSRKLLAYGVSLIKDILCNHEKVLYRSLGANRPSVTNPILRLMSAIVDFDSGKMVEEFYNNFDLNLNALPGLLVPSKSELSDPLETKKNEWLSIRFNFISFWLTLIRCTKNLVAKKDLLTTYRRITSNWFKYLHQDSDHLLLAMLEVWTTSVLQERGLKRQTKCKIFNEMALSKLCSLLSSSLGEKLQNALYAFLLKLTTDENEGILFPDDKVWFSSPATGSSGGVSVSVNSQNFKIYNKLIYTLITCLKPYDDDFQLKLVLAILASVPELTPVYTNYLFAHLGSNDPRLSSFWIGQSLLLQKIIEMPIPESVNKLLETNISSVSVNKVLENICPCPISRSSLTKCLNSDTLLIKQVGINMISMMLKKAAQVDSFLQRGQLNDARFQILEILQSTKLPDFQTLNNTLNELHKKHPEQKMLILGLLVGQKRYLEVFGSLHMSFSVNLNVAEKVAPIAENLSNLNNVDLILLDNYLALESSESNASGLKWWLRLGKDGNSLFTTLLKLIVVSRRTEEKDLTAISTKMIHLVGNLVSQSVVFSAPGLHLESLVQSLVLCVEDVSSLQAEKIWKLLDEAISRCVKSPYKYLDAAEALHEGSDDSRISPLIVALAEQFQYVDKESPFEDILKLLLVLTRSLNLYCKESRADLNRLLEKFSIQVPAKFKWLVTGPEEYEAALYQVDASTNRSYVDMVLLTKATEEWPVYRMPNNERDVMALYLRLEFLSKDTSLTWSVAQKRMVELATSLEKFLQQNLFNSDCIGLFAEKNWSSIFVKESNQRSLFVCELVNETFKTLFAESERVIPGLKQLVSDYSCRINLLLESGKDLPFLSNCLWVLEDDDLLKHLHRHFNTSLATPLLTLANRRGLCISPETFENLLSSVASSLLVQTVAKLSGPIESKMGLVLKCIETPSLFPVVESLISCYPSTVQAVLTQAPTDDAMAVFIGSTLNEKVVSSLDEPENALSFLQQCFHASLPLLQATLGGDKRIDIIHSFRLAANCAFFVSVQEQKDFIDTVMGSDVFCKDSRYIFSPEFVKLIELYESESKQTQKWLHMAMLYVTKKVAESDFLNEKFERFLQMLAHLFEKLSPWDLVTSAILNTQMEACLSSSFVTCDALLSYLSVLSLCGDKGKVNTVKLLQLFVNNEHNPLSSLPSQSNGRIRFTAACVVYLLFKLDASARLPSAFEDRIMEYYLGTLRPEDLILKEVLQILETVSAKSFIHKIQTWSFHENVSASDLDLLGDMRLFVKEDGGYVVNLYKKIVDNTLIKAPMLQVPSGAKWLEFEKFYHHCQVSVAEKQTYLDSLYDPEFIMLLVVNNEELVSFENGQSFSMRPLVESNLLQLIVQSLANLSCAAVAKSIVAGAFQALDNESSIIAQWKREKEEHKEDKSFQPSNQEEYQKLSSFKDRNLFKLFFGKLLNSKESVPSVVLLMASKMLPLISNPGHFLYEKAYRFLLAGPVFLPNDVPLFKAIGMQSGEQSHEDNYYKEVEWFLRNLKTSIENTQDVYVLGQTGVIEWCLNLQNSPYANHSVKTLIMQVLAKIQETEGGSDTLVTKFAFLASVTQNWAKEKADQDKGLSGETDQLNYEKLNARLLVSCKGNKRVQDWCADDDLPNRGKRMCIEM